MFKWIATVIVALGLMWAIGATLKQEPSQGSRKASGTLTETLRRVDPALLSAHQWQVKREVDAYFADIPYLQRVAFCESSWKHTNGDGNVVRGEATPNDVGVMQINLLVHGERLANLGLDPYNLKDNMRYARLLYEERGMKPWRASAHCWQQRIIVASR